MDDEQQQPPADDEQQQPPQPDEQPDEHEDDEHEDDEHEDDGDTPEGDTFPRSYVEHIRERSAGYRTRARDAEHRVTQLEHALFTERVAALDLLADPTDVPVDAKLLDDPEALRDAVQALVASKPHLRKRGTADGTGARETPSSDEPVSLLGIMRSHT